MNADLFRQQLVAPFAVLLELVPPPRCDDPALAVQLAGMPCVLVEHERSPAKERQPVGALHIHFALIDADGDELLCVERVCERLEAHHLPPALSTPAMVTPKPLKRSGSVSASRPLSPSTAAELLLLAACFSRTGAASCGNPTPPSPSDDSA